MGAEDDLRCRLCSGAHRAQPEPRVPPTLHEAHQRIEKMSELVDQQRTMLAELRTLLRERS